LYGYEAWWNDTDGETEVVGEETALLLLFPSQISREQAQN